MINSIFWYCFYSFYTNVSTKILKTFQQFNNDWITMAIHYFTQSMSYNHAVTLQQQQLAAV